MKKLLVNSAIVPVACLLAIVPEIFAQDSLTGPPDIHVADQGTVFVLENGEILIDLASDERYSISIENCDVLLLVRTVQDSPWQVIEKAQDSSFGPPEGFSSWREFSSAGGNGSAECEIPIVALDGWIFYSIDSSGYGWLAVYDDNSHELMNIEFNQAIEMTSSSQGSSCEAECIWGSCEVHCEPGQTASCKCILGFPSCKCKAGSHSASAMPATAH